MFDIRPMEWIDLGGSIVQLAILMVAIALTCLIAGHAYRDRGIVTAGRRAFYAIAAALTVAMVSLAAAFLSEGAYDTKFVHSHSDTSMQWFFQLAGAWAGQEGSLLFWAWILSVYGAVLAWVMRQRTDRAATNTLIVFAVVQLFFCCIVVLLEQNPFEPWERADLVDHVLTTGDGQNVRVARQAVEWLTTTTIEGSVGRVETPVPTAPRVGALPMPDGLTYAQVIPRDVMEDLVEMQAEMLPPRYSPKKLAGMVVDGAHAQGFSVVGNGRGLNPLLANYWIAIHPPCMYTGLIGCAVIFAIALGSLIGGRIDEWVRDVRPWLLFVWLFLGIGNVLGGLWAYEELGWGGFWDWDPVENAAFVPWLVATALLHTIIAQERRRTFRATNFALAAVLFSITVWSTWVTRSGAISSIHAFAEGPMIGYALLSAVGVSLAVTMLLVVHRLPLLRGRVGIGGPGGQIIPGGRPAADQPPVREPGKLVSLFSRETMMLAGAIVLLVLLVMIVSLTMWPLLSWRFGGEETVMRDRYWVTMPFFVLLYLLMGAAMAVPWRKPKAEDVRPRLVVPALIGLLVAGATFSLQLMSPDLNLWYGFAELPDADSGKINDALAAFVIPLMPPLIWGTAVFAFLTLGMEFHLPAKLRARHRLAGKPEPGADGDDDLVSTAAIQSAPKPQGAGVVAFIRAYFAALWRVLTSNRRRYGGYVAHIGALMLLVGICAATMFKTEVPKDRIPIGGAVAYDAGFPWSSTYVWTLRRFEVGVRLAVDNDELADRAVHHNGLITPAQIADDPRFTLPDFRHSAVEPTVLIRDPGRMTGDCPLPQITPGGEMPIALFETKGALGGDGQRTNSQYDMEIRQIFTTIPGPRSARAYIVANRNELLRLFTTGELMRVLTYYYGRSWLEMRVDPPAVELDFTDAVMGRTTDCELVVKTEVENGDVRLTFRGGDMKTEHPNATWRRIAASVETALMPFGIAVLPDRQTPYRLKLIPTGVSRTMSRGPQGEDPLDVPGFLEVTTNVGATIIGPARADVVSPQRRAMPTIHRYAKGQNQITREADILQGLTADEFIVPTNFLMPDASDPGGPGRTGFRFHHNPMMTWNLIGVTITILGTVICLWPVRRRNANKGMA